jgi:hypothetical protein
MPDFIGPKSGEVFKADPRFGLGSASNAATITTPHGDILTADTHFPPPDPDLITPANLGGGTKIDNVTVADPTHMSRTPHIFIMSNGDLVAFGYNGTSFGYWVRPSGSSTWGALNVFTPNAANVQLYTGPSTPYSRSAGTRDAGNVNRIYMTACPEAFNTATMWSDWLVCVYSTTTHTVDMTPYSAEIQDSGHRMICGIDHTAQLTFQNANAIELFYVASACYAAMHHLSSGSNNESKFSTFQRWDDYSRCGIVSDRAGTVALAYGCLATGTAFVVETVPVDNRANIRTEIEAPPAPAANPAAITAIHDGTSYIFIANENNAKLRTLTRSLSSRGTTSAALTVDTTITSIPRTSGAAVAAGVVILDNGAGVQQAFTTTGAALNAAIPVASTIVNNSYGVGTTINVPTYGAWTDIVTDASIVGEPVVCINTSTHNLKVFYRTNKNYVKGEIWSIARTSGAWGSPVLVAGGANTGFANPCCSRDDLGDSGNAHVMYVVGTSSGNYALAEKTVTV